MNSQTKLWVSYAPVRTYCYQTKADYNDIVYGRNFTGELVQFDVNETFVVLNTDDTTNLALIFKSGKLYFLNSTNLMYFNKVIL